MFLHVDNGRIGGKAMGFTIYSEEFLKIIGEQPKLHLVANGFKFTEGPVYLSSKNCKRKGFLFFTDQLSNAIYVIPWNGLLPFNQLTTLSYGQAALFRSPASISNGMTADLEGRLIAAEAGGRRITRTELDGSIKTLVDSCRGKKFNSPNDVVVKSDGTVWFSDPNYGAMGFGSLSSLQDCELPNAVYRFDPATKEILSVIEDLKSPNGLAFSVDEKILYVADSGAYQGYDTFHDNIPRAVYSFDVADGGKKLVNKRVFTPISPGLPDGMRIDKDGNLYVCVGDGVHVFNPQGKLLGKIILPTVAANLTFGSENNDVLFICAIDSVWAMKLNQQGCKSVPQIY